MTANSQVVILGAGPAGLGAAYKLARAGLAEVTVLEQNSRVGGNAGSFELAGLHVDYGSHRLHPACDPAILQDIRQLLGADLLDRPRHGRIRLQGRWLRFPLRPADLVFKLQPRFVAGVATDSLRKLLPGNHASPAEPAPAGENFATVMERGLGRTICQAFYFPYARKIWGVEPAALSATQARRRVSANTLTKMAGKVLAAVPGRAAAKGGRFYYPRHGYGQIADAYDRAARAAGARVNLGARVTAVERVASGLRVQFEQGGQTRHVGADHVWSTIPITALARSLAPAPPDHIRQAAAAIDFRAMLLIYLVLEQERFSEFDAHYFPEPSIPITRLSEPKNYSQANQPPDRTVICAELPCSLASGVWRLGDRELGDLVCAALERAGIPVRATVQEVCVRRLGHAYPIYRQGYETYFDQLDQWVGQWQGLLTFGRQGLFAHDNTHHALFMAYSAVACLDETGRFDQQRWRALRQVFATHVVED